MMLIKVFCSRITGELKCDQKKKTHHSFPTWGVGIISGSGGEATHSIFAIAITAADLSPSMLKMKRMQISLHAAIDL